MGTPCDVAAYVWPACTGDELRTRMFRPEGIGEWETVRKATAQFDGRARPGRTRELYEYFVRGRLFQDCSACAG